MIEVFELRDKMAFFDEAVQMYWDQWGSESNFKFYQDCMLHSCTSVCDLPRFYIAVQNDSIVGTYALLRNDLISRQDLFPWLACLYVVPELRGNKVGARLLKHALEETKSLGLTKLYLSTDLEGYYEKYDWTYLTTGYLFNGEAAKIYEAAVHS
ncbi:Acetyltransferase (GNAT) domain-containing protein [Paenibacillus algorifonticola]|uniref:Acetyltransferase (GNAT) domain-containing protein n=1 Tax=Paenibacillus algorifonticola TaxID=684063 RepID=A0A1I2J557_9BACL|nr:GNAT family N-acetyltransferase [Paenibacillus algorifonticola]SFF48056.1 Acetyltransferase (GNAT) domain-containing protein [Paenibacillus algorifonticola]